MTGSDVIGMDPTLDHRSGHGRESQGTRVREADEADLEDLGFDHGVLRRPLRGTLL